MIRLIGSIEFRAADKRSSFTGVAYSGGVMQPPGFPQLVVDLRGTTLPASAPILLDHKSDIDSVLGSGKPEVRGGKLLISGTLSDGPATRRIVQLSKDQVPLEMSIGLQVIERQNLAASESINVNGQILKAGQNGLTIVTKSELREVSLVTLGADSKTSFMVARKDMELNTFIEQKGFDPNTISDTQKASLKAWHDREHPPVDTDKLRQYAIEAHAARYASNADEGLTAKIDAIKDEAIRCDWTPDQAKLKIMEAAMTHVSMTVKAPINRGNTGELIAAGMLLGRGVSEDRIAAYFGPGITDMATGKHYRNLSLQGAMRLVLQAGGSHSPPGRFTDSDIRETFKADEYLRASGLTSMSLSGILSNVANKLLLESFNGSASTWQRFCKVGGDLADFKPAKRYRLTAKGSFEEVGKGGELKHSSLDEAEYTQQLKTYGTMITLERKNILNDDLGGMDTIPKLLGRQGAIKLEKSAYTLLLSNPSSFFSVANKNISTGAGSALGVAGLTAAETKFLQQLDSNSDPVLIVPKIILMPPSLQATGRGLVVDQNIVITGTSDLVKTSGNQFAGRFDPVVSPFLAASTGLSGSSDTAWYLLAESSDFAIMEVAFLNGQRVPVIESAELSFNTLGMGFRAVWDFGLSMLEHRGGVKSNGS